LQDGEKKTEIAGAGKRGQDPCANERVSYQGGGPPPGKGEAVEGGKARISAMTWVYNGTKSGGQERGVEA